MKKIKPTNKRFIFSGNYGSHRAVFYNDRWVKKINKKEIGSNLFGEKQIE